MSDRQETWAAKWRRFRLRTPEERSLILRACMILPLAGVGMRVFGFQRWKEMIEKFSLSDSRPPSLPVEAQREPALRAVRAVRSAELHGLTKPNCLERSMTLWWILQRQGIDGELHIGARKQEDKFEAHAWVELDGGVLNDAEDVHEHYARFDAPIAATPGGNSVTKADSQ